MAGGRPLKFKSPEELQKKIQAYFDSCWDYKRDMFGNRLKDKEDLDEQGNPKNIMIQVKPYTITGLAVALKTSRETLMDYEKENNQDPNSGKFSDTMKEAKRIIYQYAEDSLFVGKNTAGVIFNMKNNYGWKDKSEVDQNINFNKMPSIKIKGKKLEFEVGD